MFNSKFPDRVAPVGRQPNLAGDKYGRLTLVEEEEEVGGPRRKWLCRCDCGLEKQVMLNNLRSGHTTSCGCFMREVAAEANTTHGLSQHPLWGTHNAMVQRCYNPENKSFADYGSRGIQVCERWHSVENFIADMVSSHKPGLTLEREDNSLGYSKENCVWATKTKQARNTRSNRLIAYQGRNICLAEAAEIAGLPYQRVHLRLRRGWPTAKALESPDFSSATV